MASCSDCVLLINYIIVIVPGAFVKHIVHHLSRSCAICNLSIRVDAPLLVFNCVTFNHVFWNNLFPAGCCGGGVQLCHGAAHLSCHPEYGSVPARRPTFRYFLLLLQVSMREKMITVTEVLLFAFYYILNVTNFLLCVLPSAHVPIT